MLQTHTFNITSHMRKKEIWMILVLLTLHTLQFTQLFKNSRVLLESHFVFPFYFSVSHIKKRMWDKEYGRKIYLLKNFHKILQEFGRYFLCEYYQINESIFTHGDFRLRHSSDIQLKKAESNTHVESESWSDFSLRSTERIYMWLL